jgi:hypothetical protein
MKGTQLTSTISSRVRLRVPWLTKAVLLPRGGKDAARQFFILFGFYVAYAVARAASHGRDVVALANGRTLMHAEKYLLHRTVGPGQVQPLGPSAELLQLLLPVLPPNHRPLVHGLALRTAQRGLLFLS